MKKTYEDFEKKYTYDEKVKSVEFDNETQTGQLETYGKDLEKVLEIAKKTPKRVWTMIDGDKGLELVAGYTLVNRVYYIITKEEWQSKEENYLFEEIFE